MGTLTSNHESSKYIKIDINMKYFLTMPMHMLAPNTDFSLFVSYNGPHL